MTGIGTFLASRCVAANQHAVQHGIALEPVSQDVHSTANESIVRRYDRVRSQPLKDKSATAHHLLSSEEFR